MSPTVTPPEAVASATPIPPFNRWLLKPWLRGLFWLLCAGPAMAWALELATASADGAALIAGSGLWAQRFLLAALAVTPLRRITGLYALLRWRRGLGLFAFGYAALHLGAYAWFDAALIADEIVDDLLQRPAVAIGLASFVLLLPLALSANNAAVRGLGARSWQQLHGLVYSAALLAALHPLWLGVARPGGWQAVACALVLALLLGWRLRERRRARSVPQTLWQQREGGGCGCR